MKRCQQCGSNLGQHVAGGLCPACLIGLARDAGAPDHGALPDRPLEAVEINGRIPGLRIEALIGRGGMGAVYKATQTDLDREVAVKILPESLAADPTFVERFRREARALARLDHPNIVQVYGGGVADNLCYIVMELVEGVTLRDAMIERTIDPAAALRIVPQICEALEFAHAAGVVHRDIKPENILLGLGGKVKVADFGLAKLSGGEVGETMLTRTGAAVGTMRYMAPEQFDGVDVDHRTDIYALGVVFYELLTGRVPMGHFPPPSDSPGVDPRIDAVVMRTLQREPSKRYQAVSEVHSDLYKISKNEPLPPPIKQSSASTQGQNEFRRQTGNAGVALPGYEWKSRSMLWGYPILHVAFGFSPETGDKMVARGVIAVGDVAFGLIAFGGAAFGLISAGGFSVGLTAVGGAAIGLLAAYGGAAVGSMAFGGAAVGLIAFGGGALGLLAMGGGAAGYIAVGGGASGVIVKNWRGWSDPTFAESTLAGWLNDPMFAWWLVMLMTATLLIPLMSGVGAAAMGWIQSAELRTVPNPMPLRAKTDLIRSCVFVIAFMIGFIFIARMAFQMSGSLISTPPTPMVFMIEP